MQGNVIFSPSALIMVLVSCIMMRMASKMVMRVNLVRLAGWVTMVVPAGEVAGVEEARVSRARVRSCKSTILNSFRSFRSFSEGRLFKVS